MTSEGPVNWYLSVKYDRCPVTGAVSANQELYINKILQRWGMSNCHALPTPFPAKADDVITALAEPILNPDPKIIKEFQELCGALLYVQVHTVPEISWALSILTKYMTKLALFIWPQPKRFYAISKVVNPFPLPGAPKLAKSLIYPATSTDMPMPVSLTLNPNVLLVWATFSSSTMLQLAGVPQDHLSLFSTHAKPK
jgi:hypothetical protein